MLENVIKKLYPIRDEKNRPCTFPNFGSQVFGDDEEGRALWQAGKGFYADDSKKLDGKTWAEWLLDIYPVGRIYMSVNGTSPASLFGGTWEMLHDYFLLAAGPNYSAGSTGGNSEILIEANNLPEHTHTIVTTSNSGDLSGNGNMLKLPADYGSTSNGQGNTAVSTNTNVTAKNPVSIMPPYLAVYTWKRVA